MNLIPALSPAQIQNCLGAWSSATCTAICYAVLLERFCMNDSVLTLSEVLRSLCLSEYVHVVVRHRDEKKDIHYLGGGTPGSVIRRFGERVIWKSFIEEHILVIFVK